VGAAAGAGGLESVVVQDIGEGGKYRRFRVDVLCLALGMTPLAELAAMRGCRMVYHAGLGGFFPWHDEDMRTDQPGVYVAGDAAGVEEASIAMEEGRMAGLSVAKDLGAIKERQAERRKACIRKHLDELRGGPHGAAKLEAKRSIR
jgi:thioredoxin reductase